MEPPFFLCCILLYRPRLAKQIKLMWALFPISAPGGRNYTVSTDFYYAFRKETRHRISSQGLGCHSHDLSIASVYTANETAVTDVPSSLFVNCFPVLSIIGQGMVSAQCSELPHRSEWRAKRGAKSLRPETFGTRIRNNRYDTTHKIL
jgi:hypothetical protein